MADTRGNGYSFEKPSPIPGVSFETSRGTFVDYISGITYEYVSLSLNLGGGLTGGAATKQFSRSSRAEPPKLDGSFVGFEFGLLLNLGLNFGVDYQGDNFFTGNNTGEVTVGYDAGAQIKFGQTTVYPVAWPDYEADVGVGKLTIPHFGWTGVDGTENIWVDHSSHHPRANPYSRRVR